MRATVFDSYAVLALLFEEAGAPQVKSLLHEAAIADQPILISAANWVEVLYRVQREQGEGGVADAKRFELTVPLDIVPVDRAWAEIAAEFKAAHKMSLADAFAAALARLKKAQLVTGDPEFKAVERQIKVMWLK